MYGTIIGDIVGSSFERHPTKDPDFELFRKGSRFTDDTVMSVAVGETILKPLGIMDTSDIEYEFVSHMQKWGRKYPNAGYGKKFSEWIRSEDPQPYNSYGNGSAMRVAAIGWKYKTDTFLLDTFAHFSAIISHDHKEGIKGALAVASAVGFAAAGKSKEQIKNYIVGQFGYDLDRTWEEIRKDYTFDVSCQGSVPEAIIAFLDGNNFEECIRLAVALGGDADTQAAIAGSIAEAYYGIPQWMINKANDYIPGEMKAVMNKVYKAFVWHRSNIQPND